MSDEDRALQVEADCIDMLHTARLIAMARRQWLEPQRDILIETRELLNDALAKVEKVSA